MFPMLSYEEKRIDIVKPGLEYHGKLIECPENPHTVTPRCPNCGNDESMLATFDLIEYVSLAQTRYFQGYRCDDCGGEAVLTYLTDDAKLDM